MEAFVPQGVVRYFRRREHLVRTGEQCDCIFQLEEGWACRYCILPGGRRQITEIYLPGDYCEPQWLLSGRANLPIVALTGVRAKMVPLTEIHARSGGVRSLLTALVQMLERQSRWIVSLGRKTAVERVADLLDDLSARLATTPQPTAIPLTQRDIADAVGLTPVHVNRVLHTLREQGVVKQEGRTLILCRAG